MSDYHGNSDFQININYEKLLTRIIIISHHKLSALNLEMLLQNENVNNK